MLDPEPVKILTDPKHCLLIKAAVCLLFPLRVVGPDEVVRKEGAEDDDVEEQVLVQVQQWVPAKNIHKDPC